MFIQSSEERIVISPERTLSSAASIVRCVPSISYPELSPVAVIALSVKVKAASAE